MTDVPCGKKAAQPVVRRVRPGQQRLDDALRHRLLAPHIQLRADRTEQIRFAVTEIEGDVQQAAFLLHAQLRFKRHAGRGGGRLPFPLQQGFRPLFEGLRGGDQRQRRQRAYDCFFSSLPLPLISPEAAR